MASSDLVDMECSEIEIPAPWGHIAVKLWGDVSNEAVIVTHGQTDNAGSFDALIPQLPPSFYYICLDLPGHGRSSHFSLSQYLHSTDLLLAIRIVAEHFGRTKYVFLGHCFGGQLNLFFAQMYPDLASKVILLDTFYLYPTTPEKYIEWILDSQSLLVRLHEENDDDKPRYTWNEIVDKLVKGRWFGQFTWKTAENFAKRLVKKVGEDQYVITNDRRLKIMNGLSGSWDYVGKLLKDVPVTCPVLFLMTSTSKRLPRLRCEQKKRLNFDVRVFEGHHDSHATNPEVVAPHICEFLLQQNSKL